MVFGGLGVVWSTVGGKCLHSAIAADCFEELQGLITKIEFVVLPPEPPISMLGCFDVCLLAMRAWSTFASMRACQHSLYVEDDKQGGLEYC